jgi:hypothetical protein
MSTVRDQQLEVAAIMRQLGEGRALKAKLQGDHASGSVKASMNDILAQYLDSGQIITRILRLPDLPRMTCLEYLHGDAPYAAANPGLKVTLLNTSKEPKTVLMGKTWHPRIDYETDEEIIDEGWMESHEKTVAPGDTITVPAPRASGILHRHCKEAWMPERQNAWPHDDDCFVEVAYEYTLNGETFATKKRRSK